MKQVVADIIEEEIASQHLERTATGEYQLADTDTNIDGEILYPNGTPLKKLPS